MKSGVLKLPAVIPSSKLSNMPTGSVTPFINNKDYYDGEGRDYHSRKTSKVDMDDTKSPDARSVRFYASHAYNDATYKRKNVLDLEENLWPLDKTSKVIQDHFVSM